MRSVRWHGNRDLRLDQVPSLDPPGVGEAIVRVAYCGICGTDLHEYTWGPYIIRSKPHPLTGALPPVTLGHEFSGTIHSLGDSATEFSEGDRVVVDPCWSCGECYWCMRGDYQICRVGGSIGLASDGAFAPVVRVPITGLIRLPPTVSEQFGAVAEPLAVGLHAVKRGRVSPGDRVLVLGGGPIGVAVVLAALVAGASEVFVSEPQSLRRHVLGLIGVDEAFDPTVVDIRREIYLRTNRTGPDVVFECTGISSQLSLAVETARRGGRIVVVGIGQGKSEFETARFVLLEKELIGTLGYNFDIESVVSLMERGRINPSHMITRVIPLDAVTGYFQEQLNSPYVDVKVLVDLTMEMESGM